MSASDAANAGLREDASQVGNLVDDLLLVTSSRLSRREAQIGTVVMGSLVREARIDEGAAFYVALPADIARAG